MGAAILRFHVSCALDARWAISSVFSRGILGLFLLGMLSRANNGAAMVAVLAGVSVIAWMVLSALPLWPDFLASLANPFHKFLVIVFGTLTILFTGVGVTLLRRDPGLPSSHPS